MEGVFRHLHTAGGLVNTYVNHVIIMTLATLLQLSHYSCKRLMCDTTQGVKPHSFSLKYLPIAFQKIRACFEFLTLNMML